MTKLNIKEFIGNKLNAKFEDSKKLEIYLGLKDKNNENIQDIELYLNTLYTELSIIFYGITIFDSNGYYILDGCRNKIVISKECLIKENSVKIEINITEDKIITWIHEINLYFQKFLIDTNQESILLIYDNVNYYIYNRELRQL